MTYQGCVCFSMIWIGPSGNSDSFYEQGYKSSVQMPGWLRNMGLNAYEYSCSKGVKIREETAWALGKEAEKNGIMLSIHAPYYINMASRDEKIRNRSVSYILETLEAAKWIGAKRVVVHTGSCSGMDRKEAFMTAESVLVYTLKMADELGLSGIHICPETLGKINQLGTLSEILHMCLLDERLIPTIDFAHLHARSLGKMDSLEAFENVIRTIENYLGSERMKNIHIHFSRIEFGEGGEKRHRTMDETEYGPEFKFLAEAVCKFDMSPVIICESRGVMAEDAVKMLNIYKEIAGGGGNEGFDN